MNVSPNLVRFPYPLSRADRLALRRLESEFDEMVVSGRIGPEGERQVRTASGEIYSIDALRVRRRRRPGPDTDPLPPAPAAALTA
ncbi:MAG: hypothetical protein ACOY93_08660 [Bacillota bacterium]